MNDVKTSWITKCVFIALSICVVSLPVYLFLFGKKDSSPTLLKTLIQKTPTIETLSPRFFSDYLGLSPRGQPLMLKKLDVMKIQAKLKEFPIFSSVKADFTKEGGLLVSYELRKPLFLLRDFSNCGIDTEGCVLPIDPFYSPKKLPAVYLGVTSLIWNRPYDIDAAKKIYSFFGYNSHPEFIVQMIDLSKLNEQKIVHQEIIVLVKAFNAEHFLRIKPQYLDKALKRYVELFKEPKLTQELKQNIVFDARTNKFATLRKI